MSKAYPLVSGIVFGILTILHGFRMVNGIEIYINGQLMQVGWSLPLFFLYGFLSAWGFSRFVKLLHS